MDPTHIEAVHAAPLDDILAGAMVTGRGISARVVSVQPAATLSTPRQALQQGRAFSHRASGLVRLGTNVRVDAGLVGLERGPIAVAGMMLAKEHRPLRYGQMTSAPSEPSLFVDIAFMTTPSVDVSASIHRMGEHIMNRGVSGSDPTDLAFHVLAHGEGKTLGTEPEPDLADRSQFGEFRKDRAEGVDDGCVGMKTHFAICFSPHEAHGQASAQFAARRLVADSSFESGAQDVQFRFRHDALQPEDQAIVEKRRMIDAVAIADQRVGHAAEIEQAIPVGIIARQAGDFQSEHDAHAAESDIGGEACEPGALSPSRTRKTQVFVDDGHLFPCPAQLAGFLDESILASRGLAVVFDLGRAGLTNVDDRRALRVVGFDFARIIHGFSPPPDFAESPGR